uniref:Zinc finger protein 644a n=1 Tax=Cyprinus carpio carpio TaxID=630221 RepID=A0A8C1C2C0_CYPCA
MFSVSKLTLGLIHLCIDMHAHLIFSPQKQSLGFLGMSCLEESAKIEENDTSMSRNSQDILNSETFCAEGTTSGPSVHCPEETMALLSDQGDLLTTVGFMDTICSDGPAKAAYVNGSTSPHISDEILLDISKNVPGFLPKSLHAQNSVTTNVHFEGPDPLRKEGEITIRQTLTAEDVEHRGIWGFDTESPESSLDHYDDGNDLNWNPQREFMKFLWDDDNGLEMEGKLSPVPSPINHKRRAPSPLRHKRRRRKEKLVLKVDPSEDIYPELNFESKKDHLGEGSQIECSPVKKTRSPRKPSKLKSPIVKRTKYFNGAAEAVKHLFAKPAKPKPISKTQKLGLIRETLPSDSCSVEEPTFFPHNSGFKEKSQEHRQITCNTDTTSSKPFICKECGQCYHDQSLLLNHISVHQDKRPKITEEINGLHQIKDEGKDAKLQCPQCTFGTNCPNTFVQHAKTHEKDKRYYSCNKCDFVEMNEVELRRHLLHKHGISGSDLTVWKSDGFQERKVNKSVCPISFSRPFQRKIKNIIGNHVEASCQPQFIEDQASSHSLDNFDEEPSPTEKSFSVCNVLTSCAKPTARSPKLSVKIRASDKNKSLSSSEKCGLVRKKKVWMNKGVQSQSRIDKSIPTLLSRKKHSNQSASECNTHQEPDGSSTTECLDDSLNCETTLSGTGASLSPLKCLKRSAKEGNTKRTSKSDENITCSEDVGNTNYMHISLGKQTLKKSPSKRKMSTPFHNMQGQDIILDFPKRRQNLKKPETSKRSKEIINNGHFMCDSNDDLGPEECESNENANARFVKKQTSPAKASLGASTGHFGKNHSSPRMLSVKDECKDEEISEAITVVKREPGSDVESDLKACPYCPAVFESGISLSNHIRGHLHRVGLKVRKAAAKVTSLEKIPPVRRRTLPQVKTGDTDHPAELKTDCQQTELICPLCREWFDTGTGLSNHVRGHLKRLGKPSSTASKSPVIILKELMRDKKQFQMKLQVLEKKCRATNSFHPIRLSNGLTFASTVKRQKDDREEKKRIDIGKASPPSELIGILKKRRAHEETKAKHSSHTARKAILLSSDRDCGMEIQPFKAVPNSLAAFDCKQRKQRSRSGSKKKMYPLLHTPEEIYRLTCRFCDLVFQGPLSVQEDWIKHLQRHIMNTAVPHTGAGMVEVTSFPKDSCPNTVPQAQPSVMQISS